MRIHLPLPRGQGRAMRADSQYHRFAYLAPCHVYRARVMGQCKPATAPVLVGREHDADQPGCY